MCHFPDKADYRIGPGLKGLLKNKQLPSSQKPATEDNVREQIPQGSQMGMPTFADQLAPADLENVIAYLKTL